MAHAVLWPKKAFFYPFGNTPAVCLTNDLPPEESVKALLLGCGDPRHILYTLYSSGADNSFVPRTYDFTCCDVEPAVLARNTLLFSLILDDAPAASIWNIFFHLRLDAESYNLLIKQCQKLVEYAEDLSSWQKSPYGNTVRVCTKLTLAQLRHQWSSYAGVDKYSPGEMQTLRAKFKRASEGQVKKVTTGLRSAGLFAFESLKVVPKHYDYYWKKGVSPCKNMDPATPPHVNPTLAFSLSSEDDLTVHYGSDPLLPFHLAPVLTHVKGGKAPPQEIKPSDLGSAAREQFRNWCSAFKTLVKKEAGSVVVRMFVGDALAFCRALHHCALTTSIQTGAFVKHWSGSEIVLDGGDYRPDALEPAPLSFNVIDTSNLIDHIGLINVLVGAAPLLSRTPSSALFTEAILSSTEDSTTAFTTRLFMEIPIMGLFLGLTPTASISNFTTHSNIHEVLAHRMAGTSGTQFFERLSWKVPYKGDIYALQKDPLVNRPVVFNPTELADILLEIYRKMFADEDSLMNLRRLMQNNSPSEAKFGLSRQALFHYVRATYAGLLKFVKDRTSTDWTVVMDRVTDLIMNDSTLVMGMNNFQDLCCQLHIRGVHTVDHFELSIRQFYHEKPRSRFKYWKEIPKVVCAVMVIPRAALKKLESLPLEKVGTPSMHCDTIGERGGQHAIYASPQFAFGSIEVLASDITGDPKIQIREDAAGWSGTSPLIASWWIPSWNLLLEPKDLKFRLGIKSTPQTSLLIPHLGYELVLHSVNTSDPIAVHILRERPNISNELGKLAESTYGSTFSPTSSSATGATIADVKVNEDRLTKVSTLTIRSNVEDPKAKASLSSGAQLQIAPIGPCTMRVTYPDYQNDISFPFPIDGERARLRIARKSSYLEVVVPLSGNQIAGGYNINQFPVISAAQERALVVWNLHRLHLPRLPALHLTNQSKVEKWLYGHLALMFSDRERDIRERMVEDGEGGNVLVSIKDSLYSILRISADRRGRCAFGLSERARGGIYAMIFVADLRLDLASHTVVADSFILPLTEEFVPTIGQHLGNVSSGLPTIETSAEERSAWMQLLPALTERCRQWEHKKTCEYLEKGKIPLSLDYGTVPICTCGRGIGTEELTKVSLWKPFARYATRMAVSPLFAVSYLDTVAGRFGPMETREAKIRNKMCASCKRPPGKKLHVCKGCEKVCYCSPACQKAHWTVHKPDCRLVQ
ncbi:hypothetical protein BDN72DRAFT_813396 [Pluteus cervinus]|uniref:Uncharacterized protein n=1 Tax=Pluteus cervinus TaxID=181527 RepID=A0ACD3B946_9AGAR|nr:hypothetical protein BDN72DRAFT_813396 [Pluteus cervinus]